jgi:hypothetical protein
MPFCCCVDVTNDSNSIVSFAVWTHLWPWKVQLAVDEYVLARSLVQYRTWRIHFMVSIKALRSNYNAMKTNNTIIDKYFLRLFIDEHSMNAQKTEK